MGEVRMKHNRLDISVNLRARSTNAFSTYNFFDLISIGSHGSGAVESRNWLELPSEVTAIILEKVGVIDILNNAKQMCKSWRDICRDPSQWRSIDLKFDPRLDLWLNVEILARHAIDRSCGQLVDLTVAHFATDDFIRYLSQSSTQLRRLQIICCAYLSGDVLKETASKFLMLEELKVQSTSFSVAAVEVIGSSCPRLKIFKCNSLGFVPLQAQDDELANIIAHSMPHLCHLQLLGTKITNTGLKAILKGCPCLETLDMRGCSYIDPKVENLGAVCLARCKKVRLPSEPIEPDELEHLKPTCYSHYDEDSLLDEFSDDFDVSDHLNELSDFDDLFYDEDGVNDFDDIFDNEDDKVDYEEEFELEEEVEVELELEEEELEMGIQAEEVEMRMAEVEEELELAAEELEMRIEEEEAVEELDSELEEDELESEEDEDELEFEEEQ